MEYLQELINQAGALNALYIVLVSIGADTFSGFVKHLWLGDVNSKKFRSGLIEKIGWAPLLIVGYAIYFITGNDSIAMASAVVVFIAEFISIIENMIEMNLIKNETVTKYFKVSPIDREKYKEEVAKAQVLKYEQDKLQLIAGEDLD